MARQAVIKPSVTTRGGAQPGGIAAAEATAAQSVANARAAKRKPLLLGHRGARPVSRFALSGRAAEIPPENTLACFDYALAHGCDGFEFDVRMTRDGRLVLSHNAWLRGYKVSASLFNSLCLRCCTTLPCLEDVLAVFADRAFLDIEIKVPGTEDRIAKALRRRRPQCGYLLSSFLPEVLLRLHSLDPSLPLGYVCKRSSAVRSWRELPIEVFLPHHKLVSEELVRQVHDGGLRIFTWTVNRERELHQLAAWGVDGLISDDPRLLNRSFTHTGTPDHAGTTGGRSHRS